MVMRRGGKFPFSIAQKPNAVLVVLEP